MDLVNGFLNIFAPIFGVGGLVTFLPVYVCFKFAQYILRSLFSENVAGKVVVIVGCSSGMGEHVAYEYATRGACLVLAARRENSLREVAEGASLLGSPAVVPVRTDVSKVEDCDRLIRETITRFGRLDHLVICVGVTPVSMFEDLVDVPNFAPGMNVNFWGPVYTTYFAIPHLRQSRGKIVMIASSASWLNAPRMSFYNASKAAVVSFFETLRVELGSDIGITLLIPGLIESEMTKGKFLSMEGKMVVNQDLRDIVMSATPIERTRHLAKALVSSACRGDKYLTEPSWFGSLFYVKMLFPELIDWLSQWFFIVPPGEPATEAISKKVVDLPGVKDILYPESLLSPEIKRD